MLEHACVLTACLQVSLGIRLAVGITSKQQAAGTDALLAGWLAIPANVYAGIRASGLPDPVGPHALIKWMMQPEIWDAPVRTVLQSE
jgi:hypothetical protein